MISNVTETYPLSINKTLQANLPQSVEVNKNEIHITEKGRIYITDKYGDLVNCNTGVVEINNPMTTSSLEYGTFSSNIDQIQSQLSVGSIISLNVVKNGNIELIDNSVVLKKNKTYDIEYCMLPQFASNQGQLQIGLYIVNTDNYISTDLLDIIPSSGALNRNGLPYNSCIYTPSEDVRIHMKVSSNTANVTKLYSIFTKLKIKEFRNNPVNQYGGFETTTLFDGAASNIGTYALADNVSNYDYIEIYCGISESTNNKFVKTSNRTMVKDIEFLDRECFYVYIANSDASYKYTIGYTFKDETTLAIKSIFTKGWVGPHIYKVIGVKGQLPSLLCGGEF